MTMHTLSDETLLDVCRISRRDEEATLEVLADLQMVATLVGSGGPMRLGRLEYAVALLACVLTGQRRYNPTHLPFGYSGPTVQSKGWMDRDDLEGVAKQITGLVCDSADPDAVAFAVDRAVSEALRLGFLQEKSYDAWQPGMMSGTGWRTMLTGTPYGLNKARGLARSLMSQAPVAAADFQTASGLPPVDMLGTPLADGGATLPVPANPTPAPGQGATSTQVPPAPTVAPPSATTPAEGFGEWTVRGVRKGLKTQAQRDIVRVLHAAGATGLTSDELDRKSGHTDARKILGRLAKKDAHWQAAIVLPGTSHGRYRLT